MRAVDSFEEWMVKRDASKAKLSQTRDIIKGNKRVDSGFSG